MPESLDETPDDPDEQWRFEEWVNDTYRNRKDGLQDGGPRVNRGILESYEDCALDEETEAHIRKLVVRWRAWHEALLKIRTTVPTEMGPPVNEMQILLFLHGGLDREAESQVRRNTRLYRNWYDAVNDAADASE